jgi:ATP-binding cassette subfamily B protein
VAENIALGVPAAQIDHERVRAAVRLARLEDCVNALPNQYDEALGERGARLSGGQRQRLGIARALYREASVLIMDEPTSALDGAAEREIMDMLAARREGKTVFLIAHRLSSLQHCDVIHELAKGQIIRSGTYSELSVAWSADRAALHAYAVSGVKAS